MTERGFGGNPGSFDRLIDWLVEDVLEMSDEEILLEAFELGEDTAATTERMRREIDEVIGRVRNEKG